MFSKVWLRDVGERTLATFLLAFLGLFIAADRIDISTAQAAWTAGLVAGLAVIKGALATLIGDKDSASLDPAMHAVVVKNPAKHNDEGAIDNGVLWTIVLFLAAAALIVYLVQAL